MTPITHQIPETQSELLIYPATSPYVLLGDVFKGKPIKVLYFKEENKTVDLPLGHDWEDLGLLSELTEEKMEGVMPRIFPSLKDGLYYNYAPKHDFDVTKTALESFHSLLEKLQVYTKNPYGEKCPSLDDYDISQASQDYMDGLEMEIGMNRNQWQQAQQRTHSDYAILIRKIGNNLPQSN